MIDIKCSDYFETIRSWARDQDLLDKFEEVMDYLSDYGQGETRCLVYTDFAPQSLQVTMQRLDDGDVWRDWWHGGVIFDKNERAWRVHT